MRGGSGRQSVVPGRRRLEERRHVEGRERRRVCRQPRAPFVHEGARAARVAVCVVMQRNGDLDDTLERLPLGPTRSLPLGLEHLVDLEEQPLVPERNRLLDGDRDGTAHCGRAKRRGGTEPARGVRSHPIDVRSMHVEERTVRLHQMAADQRRSDGERRAVVGVGREPGEGCARVRAVESGDDQLGEGVPERERETRAERGGHACVPVLPRDLVVGHVYSARVRISHHELDAFGRVYPSAYLRHLAAVAVDASTAAGFDARWYASAGVHWLVRRTTFDVHALASAGSDLEVRTWVEDFRRVRSQRRYDVRRDDGTPVLGAVTDWVLVESSSGKLRRIPAEMERGFGVATASPGVARAAWTAPPAPASAARATYPVRYTDLDSLMHVNNAAYLDVLFHAALDALASVGWSLETLVGAGAVPLCLAGDVEYLDAARFGDRLAITTWFTPWPDGLGVHQELARDADDRGLVRCTVRWAWRNPLTRVAVPTPAGLADAVPQTVAA